MNDDIIDPIPPPEPIKRVESRLRAWWSAWKYVAILALLLILSIALNVHQYGTKRAAKAECKTLMVAAAKAGIEAERKRATEAERRAQKIAQDTKQDTARAPARPGEHQCASTTYRGRSYYWRLPHAWRVAPAGSGSRPSQRRRG